MDQSVVWVHEGYVNKDDASVFKYGKLFFVSGAISGADGRHEAMDEYDDARN